MSKTKDGIVQIGTEELKAILASKGEEPIVVDVRGVDEYENGHIPGIPLLPMDTIPSQVDDMDKTKSYVFICRSGKRSQNVAKYLQEQGFTSVRNYDGGMLAWDGEQKFDQEWVVKHSSELYK
ncbi:rhodanese-like domain-containing protein [Shouchella shacheensis]|uniref:rhodanese-like domain-containing protein n=1 Tax=Shouchella shacheensis TaxID=1649580 RepID=UPI00073FF577|nr:rhodanese-like domain-containing protein [Shouchella shacheensis]